MATPTVHKSKRHANPMQTRNGKPRLKAFDLKALYELLEKTEKGKKRHKIAREIARKTSIG
jgi:phage terminase Nu1 subunit (DNA packaging protein)